MSQTNFEPIYEAIKTRLATLPSLKLVSRRMRHYSQTNTADCPALFMSQRGEMTVNVKGQPTKWQLRLDLYIYVYTGDDMEIVPSTQLNAILSDIRTALLPNPVTGVASGLHELVSHAWVGEEIEIFDTGTGAMTIAVVPLDVLTV